MIIEIEGNSSNGINGKSFYYIEIDHITMVEKRIVSTGIVNKYVYSLHVGSNIINNIDEKAERILSLMRAIERDKQINSILE